MLTRRGWTNAEGSQGVLTGAWDKAGTRNSVTLLFIKAASLDELSLSSSSSHNDEWPILLDFGVYFVSQCVIKFYV